MSATQKSFLNSISLLLHCFCYLFLSNKTPQNLAAESNKDLWFIMILWVGWAVPLLISSELTHEAAFSRKLSGSVPRSGDDAGCWLEGPGCPLSLLLTSARLASSQGHLWEHSITQRQKLQAHKSHNISTICFIFLHSIQASHDMMWWCTLEDLFIFISLNRMQTYESRDFVFLFTSVSPASITMSGTEQKFYK